MDISTLQGLLASAIGILLFAMGYWKGQQNGIQGAVDSLFELGILAIDEDKNVVAGPKINSMKVHRSK
jgi:hypothetical protein